ncbi:MAG: hypothetical protein CSA24_02125 [Deltaproteobacteria bacterium]|nr:MAG: hypothetical protein CSA24_02125 [Deltaproteobacteria bacterium]
MAKTGQHQRPIGDGDEVAFQKKDRAGVRKQDFSDALNINSLMDIMSILLVFLLVSITSDPWNVKQNQYMQLAQSTVDRDPQDSLAILIDKRHIVVDEEETVPIACTTQGGRQCRTDDDYAKEGNRYFIDKAYKEDSEESSFLVTKLLKTLSDEFEFAKEVHADLGREEPFKGITTIICDRDIPYRIIADVVYTAGTAGIDQLRFAVMRDSRR